MIDEMAGLAIERAGGGRLVVLIDGRSGAGKSTLAAELANCLAGRLGRPIQVVSLDDCYPGWGGLAAAAAMVLTMLVPAAPGYQRYDWALGRPAEWVPLDPASPIIIEGSGALTRAAAPKAGLRVWLDAPEPVRRQAVEHRDGPAGSWWAAWAAQEMAHMAADDPESLADVAISSPPRRGGAKRRGGCARVSRV